MKKASRIAKASSFAGLRSTWSSPSKKCASGARPLSLGARAYHCSNCSEARAAGTMPISAGEQGYAWRLYRVSGGITCAWAWWDRAQSKQVNTINIFT